MHLVLDLLRIQVAELCDYLLTLLFDFHQLGPKHRWGTHPWNSRALTVTARLLGLLGCYAYLHSQGCSPIVCLLFAAERTTCTCQRNKELTLLEQHKHIHQLYLVSMRETMRICERKGNTCMQCHHAKVTETACSFVGHVVACSSGQNGMYVCGSG